MKIIHIDGSNYKIIYNPRKQWDFKIIRGEEDVTKELKTNVMVDIMIHLIYNLNDGKELYGFRVE